MKKLLVENLAETALAFRGYNITNLGRTVELLGVDAYHGIVEDELLRFSGICSEFTTRPVDLVELVTAGVEPGMDRYAESIAVVVAAEIAQLRLLRELHEIDIARARFSFGYSLGELTAISVGGMFAADEMIRIPLSLAEDAAELAHDITMGVLFSRGPMIDEAEVELLCLEITAEGNGTIGISAVLSPNTYLLIGQGKTTTRFKKVMHSLLPHRAHLRLNSNRWPPLHTPIVRQKNIADRASVMLETLPGGFQPPCPPVLSLVTGSMGYDDHSARDVIRRWIDHPQRLWDVMDETLAMGVESIVHVGPRPNVIPATFHRLGENIQQQTSGSSLGSLGMRAVSGLARRPWLAALLPSRTALLRAPYVKHVILEDWLLDNVPGSHSSSGRNGIS